MSKGVERMQPHITSHWFTKAKFGYNRRPSWTGVTGTRIRLLQQLDLPAPKPPSLPHFFHDSWSRDPRFVSQPGPKSQLPQAWQILGRGMEDLRVDGKHVGWIFHHFPPKISTSHVPGSHLTWWVMGMVPFYLPAGTAIWRWYGVLFQGSIGFLLQSRLWYYLKLHWSWKLKRTNWYYVVHVYGTNYYQMMSHKILWKDGLVYLTVWCVDYFWRIENKETIIFIGYSNLTTIVITETVWDYCDLMECDVMLL